MKRVLHIVNRMGYGGIEAFLMNLYRNIDRKKVQFDFAVHTKKKGEYDKEIKKLGGNIYYFTSRKDNLFEYYKDWNNFLKNNAKNYSTIHMHVSSLTTIMPLVLAKKYNIKNRIIHAHNTFQKGKIHKILSNINKKRIRKYATKLFACSTEAGNYVYGNNNYENINNGIDLEKYKFNIEKRKYKRKELNIKSDETVYINIGRLTEEKNQVYLLSIFKEIYKHDNKSKLFIIGKGKLKSKIENEIKEMHLEEQVILLEGRSDIPEILQAVDIFLLPSLYEGLPVVAIEAQASGLKCFISKNVSPEVKLSNLVDFLDINKSPKEIAEYILKNKSYERNNKIDINLEKYDIVKIVEYLLKNIYI